MGGSTAVGVLISVLLFLVATLMALIAWVFLDFRKTITKRVETNGRHLDSVVSQAWVNTYRLDAVESFLEGTHDYHPARIPVPGKRDDGHGT